jgi:hypothetical protein
MIINFPLLLVELQILLPVIDQIYLNNGGING